MTWKVWGYSTSVTIGFQRAVVVEELDPALIASVDKTQAIFDRPRTRYDRTLSYFALVAFGDSRETSKAADILVKIHSKAIGTDPLTGNRYDANDPDSQLWIHLTALALDPLRLREVRPGRLSAGGGGAVLGGVRGRRRAADLRPGRHAAQPARGCAQYFE